jgi:GNAT superfamily N-acetyltransferase
MSASQTEIIVRNTRPEDFSQIVEISRAIYPISPPWRHEQLSSHHSLFPEGQFVAVDSASHAVVGMLASLIVFWDDYEVRDNWRDFTDAGMFTNHDPENGRTLYGAEVMVLPSMQGQGIGKKLYAARQRLAEHLRLLRIRAGARLAGYHLYADRLTAEEYTIQVVRGELGDPTLSFQLKQGFDVLAVVHGYLPQDPKSLGYAAVIEWINPSVATPEAYAGRDPRYRRRPEAR